MNSLLKSSFHADSMLRVPEADIPGKAPAAALTGCATQIHRQELVFRKL
jgi:hypothetical protein